MLPFVPQKMQALQDRFKQSLRQLHSADDIINKQSVRPGQKAENVFDTHAGIRLIISRDIVQGAEVLHFSASVDGRFYSFIGKNEKAVLKEMKAAFVEISGCNPKDIVFVGVLDPGKIPHWHIHLTNLN